MVDRVIIIICLIQCLLNYIDLDLGVNPHCLDQSEVLVFEREGIVSATNSMAG